MSTVKYKTSGSLVMWVCSCGATSGGRWHASFEEARKAAERHLARCKGKEA